MAQNTLIQTAFGFSQLINLSNVSNNKFIRTPGLLELACATKELTSFPSKVVSRVGHTLPGYCYLAMFPRSSRYTMAIAFGAYPTIEQLEQCSDRFHSHLDKLSLIDCQDGTAHVARKVFSSSQFMDTYNLLPWQTAVGALPNPVPVPSTRTLPATDNLSANPLTNNTTARTTQISSDVRFIEAKIDLLWPEIQRISSAVSSGSSSSSPGSSSGSLNLTFIPNAPIDNLAPHRASNATGNLFPVPCNRPMGTGGFPPTIEGQLLRILFNLRYQSEQASGIVFQASLNIADVTQIMEIPTESKALTHIEEQPNEIDSLSLTGILSRPVLIGSATWSNQNSMTEMMNLSFPNAWINNASQNTHFNNLLNSFSMAKMDVVFRLMVNSTSMYGGILAMYFDFFGRLHSHTPVLGQYTISNMDPVYLDISETTVVELTVPFSAVSQFMSKQHAPYSTQFLGQIGVASVSTLCRPPLTHDVEISLFAYLESPKVALLQEPDNSQYVVPQASIVKTITSLSHSYIPGMEDVYPLALENNYHVKRENTLRVEDVASVYGLISTTAWDSTAVRDSQIAAIDVHPMIHNVLAGPTRVIQTTRLGHLGRHFCYWNGTLEYKVQVACSKAHAGKLMIVFESGSNYQGAPNMISTNPHILLDVQENHSLEFTVPFASPTPWKPTFLSNPFGDISDTRTGVIRIFSRNACKSMVAPNTSVTVNVYLRASSDFQYAVSRNGLQGAGNFGAIIAQGPSLTTLKPRLQMNSEDFNDLYKILRRYTPIGTVISIVNGGVIAIPIRPTLPANSEINSISALASGFSFWRGSISYKFKVVAVSANAGSFEIFHIPTMGIPSGLTATQFGAILPYTNTKASNGSFFGSQTFHADIDKEWEVTVPYYSMYDHLHLPLVHYSGNNNIAAKLPLLSTHNGCLIIKPSSANVSYSLSVSMSCGADFTLLAPTAFPNIRLEANSTFTNSITVVAQASIPAPPTTHIVMDWNYVQRWSNGDVSPMSPISIWNVNWTLLARPVPIGANFLLGLGSDIGNPYIMLMFPDGRVRLQRMNWGAPDTDVRPHVYSSPIYSPTFNRENPSVRPPIQEASSSSSSGSTSASLPNIMAEIIKIKSITNGIAAGTGTIQIQADLPVDPQGLFEVFNEIKETISNLHKMSSKFSEDMSSTSQDYFSDILEQSVVRIFNKFKLDATGWVRDLLPEVDWRLMISSLLAAGLVYLLRDQIDSVFGKIFLASLSTLVSHKVLTGLQDFVSQHMDFRTRVQSGVGLDYNVLTQLCCGVLAILLNMDFRKGLSGFVKNLGEFGKALSGVRSGIDAVKIFSSFVSENIIPSISDEDATSLRSLMTDAVEVLQEVYTLNLEEMKVACFTQQAIKDRVLRADGRLQELYTLALTNRASPSITIPIRAAQEKMSKLRTEVMSYKGDDGFRIDPFHVSIFGPPGIGKSGAMNQINEDFVAFHDFPKTNKVYARSTENTYWDGYMGQTTVMFDDLGQIATVATPSDLSELISLKSNAPYQVHMASIAEKGKFFTSQLIISSTNFSLYNDCQFVKEKAALHRRRNVLIEMRRREGHVGFGELEGEEGYAEYRLLDPLTADPLSIFMTYDLMIRTVLDLSKTYYDTQKTLVTRNQQNSPSNAVQALLAARPVVDNIPGVVNEAGEFIVVDAEAQAYLSSVSAEDAVHLIAQWTENFKRAFRWRDFGALASSLSFMQKTHICEAINAGSSAGLSVVEKSVYAAHHRYALLTKMSDSAYVRSQEGILRVGSYMKNLWTETSPTKKAAYATALVAFGAVGVAYSLSSMFARSTPYNDDSNIDINIFSEDGYQESNKDRSMPVRHAVRMESGRPLKKTRSEILESDPRMTQYNQDYPQLLKKMKEAEAKIAHYQSIVTESGIDDYKTARRVTKTITLESAQDFVEWSLAHPGLIPYRHDIEHKHWYQMPRIIGESKEWKDYIAYCNEKGHTDFTIIPESDYEIMVESGIDDYKTTRRVDRKIVIEGWKPTMTNPMQFDVPQEVISMTEEEMIAILGKDKEVDFDSLTTITTPTCAYKVRNVETQSSSDQSCQDFIMQSLVDNMGLIFHVKSGLRMRVLAVDDNFIIVPKHFFLLTAANWQENDLFKFVLRGKLYEQDFTFDSLLVHPTKDLAMYLLSVRVTGAKSIISRIANADEHIRYKSVEGTLVSLNRDTQGRCFIDRHHIPLITRMTRSDSSRIVYPIGEAQHVLVGYSYPADTQNGDCGSILLQNNVNFNGKIIGFHVAAQRSTTNAFSEILVREDIVKMKDSLTSKTGYITSGTSLHTFDLLTAAGVITQGTVSNTFKDLSPNVDIIGALNRDLLKKAPCTTELKKSPIYDFVDLEHKTEPAVLDYHDPRCTAGIDPLVNTVSAYGLASKPFSLKNQKIIVEHMTQKFRRFSGYINKRVLTLSEAINGIEGVEYADSMNMKSAEGSFWNLDRPFWSHNKEWMFENTAEEGFRAKRRISHRPLLEKLVHRLQEAKQGRRVLSVSSEGLKDERRPYKKTNHDMLPDQTPATRSFTILPVDYNILVRQFFWDFTAMIMKNRGKLGPQVGIDPCSIEWTGLMLSLLAKSDKGFAGDFKNYDRQTPAEYMDATCDIINGWYDDGPVNAQIRKVLMGEAYDRASIVRNGVVHIDKGLPSGFPLTTVANSVNNDQYKYHSWLELAPPNLIALDKCDQHTESKYYGDDNLHAIDETAGSFFNMRTVGRFLEEHNVMLTDEAKNHWSTAEPLVNIEDVSFLKRLFVKHPATKFFYLAPLEKRSIEERVQWVTASKFNSDNELLFENLRNSLRDAFHWGPGYFQEIKQKFADALEEIGHLELLPDITYSSEEIAWNHTITGAAGLPNHPVLGPLFGF
jgi:hypothetical protein